MPHQFEPRPVASLPKKERGKHRWIAIASYTLSEKAAADSYNPETTDKVILDQENLWDLSIGCVDCEQPYPLVKAIPCAGPTYRDPGARH